MPGRVALTRAFASLVASMVAGMLAGLGAAPLQAAEHYTLDPAHSMPSFEFRHLGITTQSGRFDRARGQITLDLAARSGSVTYVVDTASLNMGTGTETPLSPGFHLLQVTLFPTITFRSSHLDFDATGKVIAAEGELVMLGVTRPLTVRVSNFRCSIHPLNHRQMCGGDISATIERSDFGMIQYLPGVSDEVRVSIPVEAYRD
jgi:polyisoprenoid-binding protein YceI